MTRIRTKPSEMVLFADNTYYMHPETLIQLQKNTTMYPTAVLRGRLA